MRWKHHDNTGKVTKGDGAPPQGGALYFVDESGSKALINGQLYIDGQPAPVGQHTIALRDGDLPVQVDVKGQTSRKAYKKRGGKP